MIPIAATSSVKELPDEVFCPWCGQLAHRDKRVDIHDYSNQDCRHRFMIRYHRVKRRSPTSGDNQQEDTSDE